MENDVYEEETVIDLPLSRLAIRQPVDKIVNNNLINNLLINNLKENEFNNKNQIQNNLIKKTKNNKKEAKKKEDKFITSSTNSLQQHSSSSDRNTKLNDNKCSETILTTKLSTIHQLNNNNNEDEQQNSLCNLDFSSKIINDCTITSSNLIQNLESLESTLLDSTSVANCSLNLTSNNASCTGSISLIKNQASNAASLGRTSTPKSLMTTCNNNNQLSNTSLQHQTNSALLLFNSSTSNNFKSPTNNIVSNTSNTNNSCDTNNCAVSSISQNQLFRGQEMIIQQQDMFISNGHHLMCFCQQQTPLQNHSIHSYTNHHPNINHQINHHSNSFHPHHSVHHAFLNSQSQTNSSMQQSINNNSSLVAQNFSNANNSFNGNSLVNNNVVNLNNSNNRKYLNGSPVNHQFISDQISDSNLVLNNSNLAISSNNSNVSSEDSLASLENNNSSNTVRLNNNKSRKRRKKDKRKFKQNLSSSFEQLNTNDNSNSNTINANQINKNTSPSNMTTTNSSIAPIDIQTPINKFHQLNSNLFGQLPNDYFYLNFNNQQNSNQQQAYSNSPNSSSPSALCNNSNLFKNQNLLNTNANNLNSLRMDKHSNSKKLISIGHFNNSILGHLNQSTANQQCNLIKQNLLLETRHYRNLQSQQQTISTTNYRSNANNFCSNNSTGYELASSASNLCTALLTPPHSPAHLTIQNTMDTMFTLNNSSSTFQSNAYSSSNSVNQTNFFNRNYHHFSTSAFRSHHLQHFECKNSSFSFLSCIFFRKNRSERDCVDFVFFFKRSDFL